MDPNSHFLSADSRNIVSLINGLLFLPWVLQSSVLCEQLVFFVFNPALVGSNLASTITYESVKTM